MVIFVASPAVSALLSFIIPGLGQLVSGQAKVGLLFFLGAAVIGICVYLVPPDSLFYYIFGTLYFVLWLFNIINAYSTAEPAEEAK